MTAEARHEGEAARESAYDVIWRVLTEVKVAYWELAMLENQLAALRESRTALDDVVEATRARYEAGIAGQPDLLLAMVETGELDGELLHTEALVRAARAQVNLLLDRDAAAPLGRPRADSLSPFDASVEDLVASARAERPSVRKMERDVAAAEEAQRFARIGYRPDFRILGGYMQVPDAENEWRAAVGLTLPIWKARKQDALARSAGRRLDAARDALSAERNRVAAGVEVQYAHATSERELVRLYQRDVLPNADLAYQSAQANYFAGRETFLILLETLRRKIEVTKTYYEYLADSEMHLARLEEAVGKELGVNRLPIDATLDGETEQGGKK